VFGVHPLLTEAVANVAGRASSLCALFYFLAVLAFLKALDSNRFRGRALWWALAAFAGIGAWEAKQEAIALPVAMAALVAMPIALVVLIRVQLAALFAGVIENQALVRLGLEEVLPIPIYVRT
jgi:hypothetical protein